MTEETREVVGSKAFFLPMIVWPLVLVGVLVPLGLLIENGRESIDVAVPTKAIAAYDRMAADDFKTKRVKKDDVGDEILRSAAVLEGTVAVADLPAGDPVSKQQVTKQVGEQDLKGVTFRLKPRRSSTFGVTRGDRVNVHLAPLDDKADQTPLTLPALLLDATTEEGKATEYVVIVDDDDVNGLLRRVARAELLLTPAG